MKVIKNAMLMAVFVFLSGSAMADGATTGHIKLLYTGHFMYVPQPLALIVKIDDPNNQQFNTDCGTNGAVAFMMNDGGYFSSATPPVITSYPDATVLYSHLQTAYAMGSTVTIDYHLDTNFMGQNLTICTILGVYDGSFN